jgi:flagellar basal-body rod protein FlgF
MDRMIYLSMTGAKALMQRQEALAHNLANVSTTGFRADTMSFRAVPVRAGGTSTTRVANLEATAGFDPAPGPIQQTGRPLDVAVRGNGWIAVQGLDGNEAYTRNGAFVLSADGTLQTHNGLNVNGDGGPIVIPANAQVTIGSDGTVSAKTGNQPPTQIGRIKLVNPDAAELQKGPDGLMRTRTGDPAPDDQTVRLVEGALEGSNVNVVEAMVGMIALARQFEVQMKMMQTTEANEQKSTQLLAFKG